MPTVAQTLQRSVPRLAGMRHRYWRWLTTCTALLTIVLLLQPWRAPVAMAADAGPGYSRDGSAAAFIGAMQFDNANAYCLELDRPSPIGHLTRVAGAGDHLPDDIAALDETTRARLHWAVSVRGSSQDPKLTAAVAMYVWSVADAQHYRGDDHYLSLLPTEIRGQVATNLAELRSTAGDVRPVAIPQSLHVQLDTGPGHATLTIGDIPAGSEVVLRVSGGTINDARELTVSAGQAQSLRVRPDSQTTELSVEAQARAAASFATASPRFLITEGRQLLIQAATDSWPTARTSVSLRPGIRNVPTTPTPTPVEPDAPATSTTPAEADTPPASEPPVSTEPDPTPPSESAPTPDQTPTPTAAPTPPAQTPMPTPTATFSYATEEPDAPTPEAESGASPAPGAQLPSTQSPGNLAETGSGGNMLFLVGGGGLTAIGAGGWLIARRQTRPLVSDTGDALRTGGW